MPILLSLTFTFNWLICQNYYINEECFTIDGSSHIQRTLSKLVGKQPQNWADLEATMFGLRTKKQMTTQYSPYFLMFGCEARYPCEVPDNYEVSILHVNVIFLLQTKVKCNFSCLDQ